MTLNNISPDFLYLIIIEETGYYRVTYTTNTKIENTTNVETTKNLLSVLGLSVLGNIDVNLESQTTGAVFGLTINNTIIQSSLT